MQKNRRRCQSQRAYLLLRLASVMVQSAFRGRCARLIFLERRLAVRLLQVMCAIHLSPLSMSSPMSNCFSTECAPRRRQKCLRSCKFYMHEPLNTRAFLSAHVHASPPKGRIPQPIRNKRAATLRCGLGMCEWTQTLWILKTPRPKI